MNDEIIQRLLSALERNSDVMERFITAIQVQQAEWVDPDQAAAMLGFPLTPSRTHRRRVASLVERGHLTKVRHGRPPYYWKAEVLQVAAKIRDAKIIA